ncbi:MAG: hypothetical protein HC898_03655 [Phycisphaerales bacterium]|nr:hypothetical protein [Phycisphaerales bacterium]
MLLVNTLQDLLRTVGGHIPLPAKLTQACWIKVKNGRASFRHPVSVARVRNLCVPHDAAIRQLSVPPHVAIGDLR